MLDDPIGGPQRSGRPGPAVAPLETPPMLGSPGPAVAPLDSPIDSLSATLRRFDHGPLRAAARADAERQRKRPIRPKPVRHHADLTRRQVDRPGKTVAADAPAVLPEALVD